MHVTHVTLSLHTLSSNICRQPSANILCGHPPACKICNNPKSNHDLRPFQLKFGTPDTSVHETITVAQNSDFLHLFVLKLEAHTGRAVM